MKVVIQEGYDDVEIIIRCPEATNEIRRIEALLHDCKQTSRLSCTLQGETRLINIRDILYFESVDKRCFLYTVDNVYETVLKLYELEEMLESSGFLRNSKSQILNIARINSICPDFGGRIEAIMDNGEKLIISRQYSKILKERLELK